MYISYNWLKNYLPNLEDIDINKLTENISYSLAEVEKIIEKGTGLKNIVVGEILDVKNHPSSESLMIAEVDTKDKTRQIVFAAANRDYVKKGVLYPVCLPGGTIYNPEKPFGETETLEIEVREMKGVESQGMLCSPRELGLMDVKEGITIISENLKPGTDLLPLLQDKIFEIENKSLTHRPDCFSHKGIAREIAAIMHIGFVDKEVAADPIRLGNKPLTITIKDNSLCRRFSAITLQNIEIKPSPTWMQILLCYVGVRPINNIVDISNYIMLDIGYPIHMYDYDKVIGQKLIVRKAKQGELFKALNEKEYTLDNQAVVIADSKEIQNLAGIIGGSTSEISTDTKNIIIECATWDMFNIRRSTLTYGIQTEAAVRYAKGLDSAGTREAIQRSCILVEDLANGEPASEILDLDNEQSSQTNMEFDLKSIKRLIGVDVNKDDIVNILKSLQITVEGAEDVPGNLNESVNTTVKLTIPSFRKDLKISQDIIEEVIRIFGYSNVKPKLPVREIFPTKLNIDRQFINFVKNSFVESGLSEICTYSFISDELYRNATLDIANTIRIQNPLSPELGYFRNALLPSIIDKVGINIKNFDEVNIFELTKVSVRTKKNELPEQKYQIAGLVAMKGKGQSFTKCKESLEHLFEKMHCKTSYENMDGKKGKSEIENIFHPYKSARISIDGTEVGIVGELHPIVKNNFKYEKLNISIFNLDYELLKKLFSSDRISYTPVSSYPENYRDVNIWLSEKTEVGKVIDGLLKDGIEYLKDIKFVDRFEIEGKTSITLRFAISEDTRTLTNEEIQKTVDATIFLLSDKYKLQIRQ